MACATINVHSELIAQIIIAFMIGIRVQNVSKTSLVLIHLLILPFGAGAQDRNKGVAFVVAPEQSSGMCFGGNPDSAFECARKKCAANGTTPTDCLRVKWCFPSGWSADLFVQNKEGFHWHQYLCGWNSRNDLSTAAKAMCDGDQKSNLLECEIVQMWNDDGQPINP